MKLVNRGALVGDADRSKITDYIGLAYARGHLMLDEMQERVDAAGSARYWYQLDAAVRELPADIEPLDKPASVVSHIEVEPEADCGWNPFLFALLFVALLTLFCMIGGIIRAHSQSVQQQEQQEQNYENSAQPIPDFLTSRCHLVGNPAYYLCKNLP